MSKDTTHNYKKTALIAVGSLAVAGLLIAAVGLVGYARFLDQYNERIYPGVVIADHDVSGLTYLEAWDALEAATEPVNSGITIAYEDQTLLLEPNLQPSDAGGDDRTVYQIDIDSSVDSAFAIGRRGNRLTQAKDQLTAWRYGRSVAIDYTIDRELVADLLASSFDSATTPPIDADFRVDNGAVELIGEEAGSGFDYAAVVATLVDQIYALDTTPIALSLMTVYPAVTIDDIQAQITAVDDFLDAAPVTVQWEDRSWTLDSAALGDTLGFADDSVAVSAKKLRDTFDAELVEAITIEVQEAKWRVESEDGTTVTGLTEITPAQIGRTIDYQATAKALTQAIKKERTAEPITIAIEETEPQFSQDTISDLEIVDLLGAGTSNMAGSPSNRRVNVARGMELLDGLLVEPGQTFSLIDALAPFTLENQYLAELVIKGNETIPEIGGGLCQVGSTIFRGAMNSGMEIVERRNHSYDVSYYRDQRNGQPGTDATIYEGAVDFKFTNDTGNYVLLQARIDGNDLTLEMWGKNDGRVAYYSEPQAYNWVSPPPTKEIPTTDLAPGERKCTESAHAGVTAEFTYTIERPDGSVDTEDFRSVYKPWQAVCLVGQEPDAPAEPAAETDTAAEVPAA